MGLNVRLLQDSFNLVIERDADLARRFYAILFSRYPQVKPLFGRNSAQQQQKMLVEALSAVLEHLEDASWLEGKLSAMGEKHVDYGVTDEMYAWVTDAMLSAIGEVAGADWTPELAGAWRAALGAISGMMQQGAKRRDAPMTAMSAVSAV